MFGNLGELGRELRSNTINLNREAEKLERETENVRTGLADAQQAKSLYDQAKPLGQGVGAWYRDEIGTRLRAATTNVP